MASSLLMTITFFAIFFFFFVCIEISNGKKLSITDDLEDVVDDEEDESWKEWGRRKTTTTNNNGEFSPPEIDPSKMSLEDVQAEMMRRNTGRIVGFVKLRPGNAKRSRDDVPVIAMRWSKVLRTGSVAAMFMAVDGNTIMFNMERGQDTEELKEFVLSQPEAYEIKIGDQLFRRPGDPPLEQVMEKLRLEMSKPSNNEEL